MIGAEEIPDWVPAAVMAVAPAITIGTDDMKRRLLVDPRMKDVWSYLLRDASIDEAGLAALPTPRVMSDWGIDEYHSFEEEIDDVKLPRYVKLSLQQRACAAFFACALAALTLRREPVIRAEVDKYVGERRAIADQCRLAANGDITLRARPEIADALLVAAKYFDDHAALVAEANENSPLALQGEGMTKDDDIVRGQVRALALESQTIFGSPLLGITAKVASIALQRSISKRAVQYWCEDLPHTNARRS